MSLEIERKFLVKDNSFVEMSTKAVQISQGYLSSNPESVVRVRIADEKAFLTVKSKNRGCVRGEWEYPIPKADAEELMMLCSKKLIKTRYIVPYKGFTWEVDFFHGQHEGLIVAEIELPEENAQFDLPPFIGNEVTGDPRYYNSNLCSK